MIIRDDQKIAVDKKLRAALLMTLHRSTYAPMGGIKARMAFEVTADSVTGNGIEFEDEDHAMRLLIDLRGGGYVELLDMRTKRYQRGGIDAYFAKATPKGSQLVRGEIPVDPMVDDERI